MPKVRELKPQYMKNDIGRKIEAQRAYRNMSQLELAEMVGLSQQNLSRKIQANSFKYEDLIRLFDALKMTDEQILRLMKL